MSNINFTPFPTLETNRLILRLITMDDLDAYFILKSDERILKGYDAKPRTYEETRQKLQRNNEELAKNEWVLWGIAPKATNKLIGSICFWNISAEQEKAEIGYELMVEWQGKGIMKEALTAVIDYGFEVMKLQLIEAFPNPQNASSVKLLERNGFVRGEEFSEIDQVDGKSLKRVTYILSGKKASE